MAEREWITGIYCGEMPYKRYRGMGYKKFYKVNKDALDKFIIRGINPYLEQPVQQEAFSHILQVIYTDIIEGD